MKVAAVNTRLDTYMHHLSESARAMWKGRLMAIIDQPNVLFCVQKCADTNILPFYFHAPSLPHNAIDLLKSSAQAPTASADLTHCPRFFHSQLALLAYETP